MAKANLCSPARDKAGGEISVFTLADQTKLGRDNCGIKLVPPQEVVLTYPGITVIIGINYPVHRS